MRNKLFVLAVLYFVQGLPYGFQLNALPVFLRAQGVSLASIGLASALALPWSLKILWAPLVDRYGSDRLGRRRSWILPLQLGLALTCTAAAFLSPEGEVRSLLLAVLIMNLLAATMDVAVDGLAIDALRSHELGYGNIAQVVGYKVGMLAGGGLLVWASTYIGWQGLFLAMGGLVLLTLLVTLAYREPATTLASEQQPTLLGVLGALWQAVRQPGAAWLLIFIATYKLGETLADIMFKPYLVDAGFQPQQIGLWVGTWGLLFSLAGSFLGGMLASRVPLLLGVGITATLRAIAVGGEWWLTVVEPTASRVIAVVAAEQCFGGALTTAMFAYMMFRVDRRIGASHYTLLATVEVSSKLAVSFVSGILAERLGYSGLFALATVLAFLFLGLLLPLSRYRPNGREAPVTEGKA